MHQHPSCSSRLCCRQLVLFLLVTFSGLMSMAGAQQGTDVLSDNNTHYVKFYVQLDANTTDFFTVEVHNDWAPLGAARFLELVDTTTPAPFFAQVSFFRVLTDFVAQFGISGDPAVSAEWQDKTIQDDPVLKSNFWGSLTFATGGANTRTTQIFINLQDNRRLDELGFTPFAEVVSGMQVVEQLYAGYGEGAPMGNGPDQSRIQEEGNTYLEQDFPLLSYILSAERVPLPAELEATEPPNDESQATQPSVSSESLSQATQPSSSESQATQPSISESQTSQPSSGANSLAWKGGCLIFSSVVVMVTHAAV